MGVTGRPTAVNLSRDRGLDYFNSFLTLFLPTDWQSPGCRHCTNSDPAHIFAVCIELVCRGEQSSTHNAKRAFILTLRQTTASEGD